MTITRASQRAATNAAGWPPTSARTPAMIMRNHGLPTAGETIGRAFLTMYKLVIACQTQLDAMAAGTPPIEPSEKIREFVGALNRNPDGDEARASGRSGRRWSAGPTARTPRTATESGTRARPIGVYKIVVTKRGQTPFILLIQRYKMSI